MSISNLMQHSVESPSLPYRLAPCAKAISVLFLVFSSPMVWADIHDKSQQRVEQQSSLYPSPVEQKPSPYEYSWNKPDPTGLADARENEKLAQQQLKNPDADIWNERTPDQIEAENKEWLQQDRDSTEHAETLRQARVRVEEGKLVNREQEREWTQRVQGEREWAQQEREKVQEPTQVQVYDQYSSIELNGDSEPNSQKDHTVNIPAIITAPLQAIDTMALGLIIELPKALSSEPYNQKQHTFDIETITRLPKAIDTLPLELIIELPKTLSDVSIIQETKKMMLDALQDKWPELVEKDAKSLANMVKDTSKRIQKDISKREQSKDAPPLSATDQIFPLPAASTVPSKDTAPSTTNKKVGDTEDSLPSGRNLPTTEVGNVPHAEPESTAKAVVEPKTAEKTSISPAKVAQAPVLKLAPPPKPAPIISHNPQAGSYIANQLATQQMFMTDDLQYRQGETLYTDPITGETDVSSLWLNTTGSKSRFSSGHGQLHTKSNRYAVQLGGTLSKWSSGGNDQGLLGLTAGVGKSTNHSRSTSSHHQAQGSVDGYNLGLYSIWYADNHSKTGPYIDLLAQHSWFNNHITAPKVATGANYRSYLFTTALETGYKLQLIETADTRFFIQPKAKVSWQRTSGLLHNESDTQIKVDENNAVTTKLGMRTAWEFDIDTLSSTRTLQISPSFEANWIYSRMNPGVQLSDIYTTPAKLQNKTELASIHVTPQGTRNIADLKVGIEANINKNLLVWTHLGHQFGSHNYSDTQATLGANYRF
ncbi:type V secretory pathway%2C adhesin AidA [Yersinia frederiksenii]|nr:type V secretory pathway%2C adhesin AidA [Yersinia frederiksenii]